MINFIEKYEINKIKPAKYNPRHINENNFSILKNSINELWIIQPILVNNINLTIIAWHQRYKACIELWFKSIPIILINLQNISDEIRFNQFHNFCIKELSEKNWEIKIDHNINYWRNFIDTNFIKIDNYKWNWANKMNISYLMTKYWHFWNWVLDDNWNIILNKDYVFTAKLLKKEILIYKLENNKKINYYFNQNYWEFSYKHIQKKTYFQTLAQMKRLRSWEKKNHSTLYENLVLPYIKNNKKIKILDFWSWYWDYYKRLKNENYNIFELEFYRRVPWCNDIDVKKVEFMIEKLVNSIEKDWFFDIVICDSVFNSVDSTIAEDSILYILHFFTKIWWKLFFSWRSQENETFRKSLNKLSYKSLSLIHFLDNDWLSANFRNWNRFFQKFHNKQQLLNFNKKLKLKDFKINYFNWKIDKWEIYANCWQISWIKQYNLNFDLYKNAIDFEFQLPLPNWKKYNFLKQWEIILNYYTKKNG